ncbi:TatD family hydrolase [Zhihengliuella alba]|uniref:TatD family hydrolase n=1 Tax=Zhihengliuella alba TaxID=547018 RepID=A0ABP7D6P5_9MICC
MSDDAVIPGSVPTAYAPPEGETVDKRKNYPPAPEPLPVPVPDNHTHLDFRGGWVTVGLQDALDTAEAVGVPGAVQVGCDVESSRLAVEAAETHGRLLAAVAIHPNDAAELAGRGELDAAIAAIDELAAGERVRAVGETGLDYYRTGPEGHAAQRESFLAHLEIAARRSKALQIHDRDAHADVVDVLTSGVQLPDRVVFHCFSGDAELARLCNEHGWFMSFAGTVTFKNSIGLQEALLVADPSLVMVETDAPFLTPHPYRGQPNAAYMIPYTVRFMARHLDRDLAEWCSTLADNTRRVYGDF